MYSLHLTHPKWTHTHAMLQRPGSSWGFGALLKDTSVVVLKEDTPPPPTIPAGPEIRTHNLPLTSPLSVRPRLPHKIDRCVYHLSIFLLIHLSSIYRSIHWSIYLSYFCLSIYLSVCLNDTKHVYTDIQYLLQHDGNLWEFLKETHSICWAHVLKGEWVC